MLRRVPTASALKDRRSSTALNDQRTNEPGCLARPRPLRLSRRVLRVEALPSSLVRWSFKAFEDLSVLKALALVVLDLDVAVWNPSCYRGKPEGGHPRPQARPSLITVDKHQGSRTSTSTPRTQIRPRALALKPQPSNESGGLSGLSRFINP